MNIQKIPEVPPVFLRIQMGANARDPNSRAAYRAAMKDCLEFFTFIHNLNDAMAETREKRLEEFKKLLSAG